MSYQPRSKAERRELRHACRLWCVKLDYTDTASEPVHVSDVTLLKLLEGVTGARIQTAEDITQLIEKAHHARAERFLEPVHVHWQGEPLTFVLTTPSDNVQKLVECELCLEMGEVKSFRIEAKLVRTFAFAGRKYSRVSVEIAVGEIPIGYHTLSVRHGTLSDTTTVFSAPVSIGRRAKSEQKRWGLFAPLYALSRKGDWGMGDVTSMERVQEYVTQNGGSFFGTLPLLPSWTDGDDWDPSPYSPVSRLFWNEIYLDVEKLAAEAGLALDAVPDLAALREKKFVDYNSVLRVKGRVLKELSTRFFASGATEQSEYREFLKQVPFAERYAEFRAKGDESERKYHLYVQFQMDKTLKRLNERAKRGEIAGLYLDFPVGVSRGGFDTTAFPESFVEGMNAGAPPDALFRGGQDWGFSPLHPIGIRQSRYAYFIQCIRHHMQYATVLRLDHIMAFHRIYSIPHGVGAKAGGYLRYRPEEFYALLSIEAERACVRVVGEDLGTVPDEVRASLKRHDCLRMWVLPFETGDEPSRTAELAPERSIACLNTHDMAPFAGHCSSRDITLLDQLGVLKNSPELTLAEDRIRSLAAWCKDLKMKLDKELEPEAFAVFSRMIAESRAELMLINVEDLWLETEPQNIPGTWKEYPNWRRKLRTPLEEWTKRPEYAQFFQDISQRRKDQSSGNRNTTTNDKSHSAGSGADHSHVGRPSSLQ